MKIETWIIGVIQQEKPLLLLASKPIKCTVLGYSFRESDCSEVCGDGIGCGGIN